MSAPIRLFGRITGIKGFCRAAHHLGEEFDLSLYEGGRWNAPDRKNSRTPGLCPHLYYAIFPYLSVLQYGGNFPWLGENEPFHMNCPDPENCVGIEIKTVSS